MKTVGVMRRYKWLLTLGVLVILGLVSGGTVLALTSGLEAGDRPDDLRLCTPEEMHIKPQPLYKPADPNAPVLCRAIVETRFLLPGEHQPIQNPPAPAGAGMVLAQSQGADGNRLPSTSTESQLDATRFKTVDDLFAEVGAKAPAFGGMYLEKPDNDLAYVNLIDLKQEEAVIGAIKEVFGPVRPLPTRFQGIQAEFSFLQLKEWYDSLRPQAGIPGIVATDIDDKRNRILIGIESPETEDAVRDLVRRLNIPSEAVIIEVMPRPQRLGHTLQSNWRDFAGGLQGGLRITSDAPKECTLSYVGNSVNGFGFFTVSHCTPVMGLVDNTVFFQPSSPDRIGVESLDPQFIPGGQGNCPQGKLCRHSDSAFAKLDGGITSSQGRIARTTDTGTLAINHNNPNYRITLQVAGPFVGTVLDRMGAETGWSWGEVTNACMDTDFSPEIRLFCQDWVRNDVGTFPKLGDSGSPVFKQTFTAGDVYAYGILWGVSPPKWIFSNFNGITTDMGGVAVCEPGFGC